MIWKIWYDNGSTFSSNEGKPEDAPLDGILAIAEKFDDGRKQTLWNHDYYYWTGDSWAGGNIADLERWLRRDIKVLKYGRWAQQSVWQKIKQVVQHEWF